MQVAFITLLQSSVSYRRNPLASVTLALIMILIYTQEKNIRSIYLISWLQPILFVANAICSVGTAPNVKKVYHLTHIV